MQRYVLPVGLCLTLGLAPFAPEPHIVGKLRWIAGGAVGMGPMDWFDVVLHGSPWVLLFGVAVHHAVTSSRSEPPEQS